MHTCTHTCTHTHAHTHAHTHTLMHAGYQAYHTMDAQHKFYPALLLHCRGSPKLWKSVDNNTRSNNLSTIINILVDEHLWEFVRPSQRTSFKVEVHVHIHIHVYIQSSCVH